MESAFNLCRDAERIYKELLATHKQFINQLAKTGENENGLEFEFGAASPFAKFMNSLYQSENDKDCFFIFDFFQMTGVNLSDYKLYYEIPALYVYMKALADIKRAIYEVKRELDREIYGR